MKPLCIDLFAGAFGWGREFAAEGFRVVGFDLVHETYHGLVPEGCELVLQDVLTLHGSQFRDAACIVASPPCQEFSFAAQPWKRAKAEVPEVLPAWWSKPEGKMDCGELAQWKLWKAQHPAKLPSTALFDACFRIQCEASEAAGRHIPMVVENVRGAQPGVGRASWHYGSYYLWGDVPALMPSTLNVKRPGRNFHAFENGLGSSPSFNGGDHETRGVKVPGLRHGTFPAGGLAQGVLDHEAQGVKSPGSCAAKMWSERDFGSDSAFHQERRMNREAIKQRGSGAAWFREPLQERQKAATAKMHAAGLGATYGGSFGWDGSAMCTGNSKSNSRKAASAHIAKIPETLARWIAQCYYPERNP